ncbi:hypothetical protein PENPOL_c012G09022 [Penicillium polonicum]|uniref:Uncharacterized protein n=1 Tax=Penicillium polonicum TaxID=60169 RepID=A0A1V6NCU6_PENPO|nr:hypothetical protein PENPOL_c012G09022 [Penicillium polonicum]
MSCDISGLLTYHITLALFSPESLRQVTPSTSQSSSSSAPPSAPARSQARTGGRLKRLQYLAREYFASQPGADNAAPNVGLHYCLNQVLKGASYPK